MSVDPVGQNPAAAIDALVEAEFAALAAGAQALRGQLQVGQVLSAQILASNGLTDQLEMLGNRVAAALPPTLQPGDVVQVQVTGFNGDQILLQLLDAQSPQGQTAGGEATLGTSSTPLDAGGLPTPPPVAPTTATPAATPLGPATGTPPVAPPAAVLIAASLLAAPGGRAPAAPIPGAPTAPGDGGPQIPPAARAIPFPITTGLSATPIEARLAASRTGPRPASTQPGETGPSSTLPGSPAASATPPRPFVPPPPIALSGRAVGDQAPQPAPGSANAPASAAATTSTPAAFTLASYRDPVVLVRALGFPVTPTAVAAARLALDSPQRLPNALATLEAALPSGDDPRVVTLRAMAAFVSRIDPRSPELATQIAAYVENVVDGGEAKLATALAAHEAAAAPETTTSAAAESEAGRAAAAAPAAAEAPLAVVALANAALRAVDLLHDLKQQLFSLLSSPPATAGDELSGSATGALTAITGGQIDTAATLAAAPQTVAFMLPLWTGSGYTQARIAVDRDAPQQPGVPLDGDNFHIAFILDTKNLGTVAVDLQAVGRTVNVAVKTEALPAAQRFESALGRLSERLQKLRYRVASSDAAVARVPSPATTPLPEPPPTEPPAPGELNLRA